MADRTFDSSEANIDYRTIIDAILDTEIVMLDPDGNVLTWSEGARRLKGYEAAEILGKPVSIFYTQEDAEVDLAAHELEKARTSVVDAQFDH